MRAVSRQCDVSDDAAVREMIGGAARELGRLDILVNNAGSTSFVPQDDLEGLTEEIWDRTLAVNLKGAFFCSRAAVPHLRRGGGGTIVNVASIAGIHGGGSSMAYAASKAGLLNLTVNLSRVLGPDIRVNAVAPGFTEGRWLEEGWGRKRYKAIKKAIAQSHPLGRTATPDDVAQVVYALVAHGDYVNGEVVVVDGIGPFKARL